MSPRVAGALGLALCVAGGFAGARLPAPLGLVVAAGAWLIALTLLPWLVGRAVDLRGTVKIPAPPGTVWPFVDDVSRALWWPRVQSAETLVPGDVGRRERLHCRSAGTPFTADYVVVERELRRRIVRRLEAVRVRDAAKPPSRNVVTTTLAPDDDGGTRVDVRVLAGPATPGQRWLLGISSLGEARALRRGLRRLPAAVAQASAPERSP